MFRTSACPLPSNDLVSSGESKFLTSIDAIVPPVRFRREPSPCPPDAATPYSPGARAAPARPERSHQMNSEQLQALQRPLKETYRERPQAALVTLRSSGELGSEAVSCSVQTGRALVEAGLHPASGGDGSLACSGDMLLEALVACAGVTLRAVATAIGVELRDATVRAEGDLDFRGTLGVSKDVPVGFKEIRLNFHLDTDATEEQLATLIRLTERYCVVYQTLSQPAEISVLHRLVSR